MTITTRYAYYSTDGTVEERARNARDAATARFGPDISLGPCQTIEVSQAIVAADFVIEPAPRGLPNTFYFTIGKEAIS